MKNKSNNNKYNISTGLFISMALYGCNRSPIHHEISTLFVNTTSLNSTVKPCENRLSFEEECINKYKALCFASTSDKVYDLWCAFHKYLSENKLTFSQVLSICKEKTDFRLEVFHLSRCLKERQFSIVEAALYAGVVDTTSTQFYMGAPATPKNPKNRATLRFLAEKMVKELDKEVGEKYEATLVIKALDEVEPFGGDTSIRDQYKELYNADTTEQAHTRLIKFYDYLSKNELKFVDILQTCRQHTDLQLGTFHAIHGLALAKDEPYQDKKKDIYDLLLQLIKSDAFDLTSTHMWIVTTKNQEGIIMEKTQKNIADFAKEYEATPIISALSNLN